MSTSSTPTDDLEEARRVLMQDAEAQAIDLESSRASVALPGAQPFVSPLVAAARMTQAVQDTETLEGLYATYPQLGQGEWKLRVERVAPRTYRGVLCAGFQEDLTARLTMDEFAARFGGGVYTVQVLSPVGEPGSGATGYRLQGKITVRVPGEPNVRATEETMATVIPQEPPTVAVKRIEVEADRERQLREEKRRLEEELARRPPPEALSHMQQGTQLAFEHLRAQQQAIAAVYTQEIESLRAMLRSKEDELASTRREYEQRVEDLRTQLHRAMTESATALQGIETQKVRELREQYEQRLAEVKQSYIEKLAEERERARDEREQLRANHDQALRSAQMLYETEKQRIVEDAGRRLEDLVARHTAEIERIRDTYEQRIEELKATHARELETMRERRESELRTMAQAADSKELISKQTYELQIASLRADLTRAQEEASRLREQVDKLHDRLYRPPREALAEARELLESVKEDEPEVEVEEGEPGWLKALRVASDLAKPLLESVARGAAAPPPQPTTVPRVSAEPARRVVSPTPRPGLVLKPSFPPSVQRRQSNLSAPPLGHRYGVAERRVAAPLGSDVPSPQPVSPASAEPPVGSTSSAQPVAAPTPQEQASPSPPQAANAQEGVDVTQVRLLLESVGKAMDANVPPEALAAEAINMFGRETAREMLGGRDGRAVVDVLRSLDGSEQSVLATRAGRRYLEAVIEAARAQLGEG